MLCFSYTLPSFGVSLALRHESTSSHGPVNPQSHHISLTNDADQYNKSVLLGPEAVTTLHVSGGSSVWMVAAQVLTFLGLSKDITNPLGEDSKQSQDDTWKTNLHAAVSATETHMADKQDCLLHWKYDRNRHSAACPLLCLLPYHVTLVKANLLTCSVTIDVAKRRMRLTASRSCASCLRSAKSVTSTSNTRPCACGRAGAVVSEIEPHKFHA